MYSFSFLLPTTITNILTKMLTVTNKDQEQHTNRVRSPPQEWVDSQNLDKIKPFSLLT